MDRRWGLPGAALTRFTIGLGGLVALTYHFPSLTNSSQEALLFVTVLVGMSYGMAFGTSYQMASKYPAGSTVALTTGFVSSGPVVLLLDLMLKDGPYYTDEGLAELFRWVGLITAGGLASALVLVLGSWRSLSVQQPQMRLPFVKGGSGGHAHAGGSGAVLHAADAASASATATDRGAQMRHRADAGGDAALAFGGTHSTLVDAGSSHQHYGNGLANTNGHLHHTAAHHHHHHHGHHHSHAINMDYDDSDHSNGHGAYGRGGGAPPGGASVLALPVPSSNDDAGKGAKRDLPMLALMWRIWPAAASIVASVGTSMLIFPFFTFMRSTGLLGIRFAQVLFYVRLVGDIAGRMVPRSWQASSTRSLLLWATVKVAMVPLLFGCIFLPEATGGDVGAVAVVALFWVLSGYLNTCSYVVAPSLVPPSQKARASGLMTVAFQSACFGALLVAYWIQQWAPALVAGGAAESGDGVEEAAALVH